MKEIGGYLNLDLKAVKSPLHKNGILLNTGRNALEYILYSIPNINHIWIPFFTCNAILEPIEKLNIPYTFYTINEDLEINTSISLGTGDYLLYTNYFGVKDKYISYLEKKHQSQLIIDNSQALYSKPTTFSFYSPRKFFGLPDGGIAYSYYKLNNVFEKDLSYNRVSHLLKRHDLPATNGYMDFKQNSLLLKNQPIRIMSELTKHLFHSIDYKWVKKCRINNFKILHSHLQHINKFSFDIDNIKCPLVYPFYTTKINNLRNKLIQNKIYIATYWPNVLDWCPNGSLELLLVQGIIPLPIDQRYGEDEMNYIIKIIQDEETCSNWSQQTSNTIL